MTKKSILKECEMDQINILSILSDNSFEKAKVLFGTEEVTTVLDRGIKFNDNERFCRVARLSYSYHLGQMKGYKDKIRYIKNFI